ncbi:MAG: heme lyase CcmF/NrfE family subunit [Bryobacteraceae bacterium]|nr:heme lyase CcmF/NrfE family subunit [Bryobacteraceae bacterium]
MENLGALSVLLAFCFSVYAFTGSLAGAKWGRPLLTLSAQRAIYAVWALLTLASVLLVYALLTSDFRFAYVASHTDKAMSANFKFTAWWGGQEGSLLFWSWILSTYAAVVAFTNRSKFRNMMPWVLATLSAVQIFFLVLNAFVVSPFQMLAVGKGITAVPDGQGLNPLLQYWAMQIHPPMLYLGYVGFTVPFAFALGSLIVRQPGDAWIHTTRRWTIVTWMFQTCGIVLGAGWAYAVLGWGGYWGWDPVENASLLPWITSTAFLHSVMMQEKKGMMKVWNASLISATFLLCILGTMLTRTGLVSSVHAFAQSPLKPHFTVFLSIAIAVTAYVILSRLDYLKSETQLESVVSRESSFLFNNLFLLASCFAVLWGTLFPVISEAITGEKISVDAPFFNRVNIPIGLVLLLLTGVGPLIAWRRSSVDQLRRNFLYPAILMVLTMTVLAAVGIRHMYALISFGLCAFVTATIVIEFFKGAAAIHSKDGLSWPAALFELTHRNTRRYGGYLVHMGIVLMFIGFTGAAFNHDVTAEVAIGEKFQLGKYELLAKETKDGDAGNYIWQYARLGIWRDGEFLGDLQPERRLYKASRQPSSEVRIRRRLNEDLYVNFASASEDGKKVTIQAYVFPLVSWIWIGFAVVLVGTWICLIPSKVKLQYAKTEVVGITTKENVPV